MSIDWTAVLVALLGGGGAMALWQVVRARMAPRVERHRAELANEASGLANAERVIASARQMMDTAVASAERAQTAADRADRRVSEQAAQIAELRADYGEMRAELGQLWSWANDIVTRWAWWRTQETPPQLPRRTPPPNGGDDFCDN